MISADGKMSGITAHSLLTQGQVYIQNLRAENAKSESEDPNGEDAPWFRCAAPAYIG